MTWSIFYCDVALEAERRQSGLAPALPVVLLRRASLARLDAAIMSWFIVQTCKPFLHKPLYPLVAMLTAQANGRGSIGDGHPVSQEYQQPGTAGLSCRYGGRTLPCQERLALGRREADRERDFASTRHTRLLQKEYPYVSCRQNSRAT